MRIRTIFYGGTLLLGALSVGELMPRAMMSDSLARYAASPPSYLVAALSQSHARDTYSSPFMRILYPMARVTNVAVWPANCPRTAATGAIPHREYYAEVQLYTLFNIPGPRKQSRCGGTRTNWVS